MYVWQFVFCAMGIVLMTVGRNKGQPGGSLSSVDRSPGSPRRCLCADHVHTVPDHGGLGPVAPLEPFVLMLCQCVCNTRTLQSVTIQTVGYLIVQNVKQTVVLVLIH